MKKLKGTMKKIVVVAMVSALALSVVACGEKKTETAGSAKGEKVENTGETYEIVVSLTQPAESWAVKMMKEECAKIEEETNGQLKFTIYDSGTLLKIPDSFKGVQDGMADIAFMPNNIAYDYFSINSKLLAMPMFGFTSEQQAYDIYNQLRNEFPEIDAEAEEYGIINLGAYFNAGSNLYMTEDKGITSLDDIKGMKIGSSDAMQTELLNDIGATGVYITSADAYTSLDNGVVDGIMQHALFFQVTGCADIVKNVVEFSDTGVTRAFSMLIMNKAKYDSLPEDLQVALTEGFKEIVAKSQAGEIENIESYTQLLKDNGATYTTLTDEDIAPLKELAKEQHTAMIRELEGQGVNAQAIYDRAQELIKSAE